MATQNSGIIWAVWVKDRPPRGGHLTGFGGSGKICVHLNSYVQVLHFGESATQNLPDGCVVWRICRRLVVDRLTGLPHGTAKTWQVNKPTPL